MAQKYIIHTGKRAAQALQLIKTQGGSELANYGNSILAQLEEAGAQALRVAGYQLRALPAATTLQVGGFALDTTNPAMHSTNVNALEGALSNGRSYHLLRLAGPIHPDWKRQLEGMGVTFIESVVDDLYLIAVDGNQIDSLTNLNFVESLSPYYAALKVSPELLTSAVETQLSSTSGLIPLTAALPDAGQSTGDEIRSVRQTETPLAEGAVTGNLELVLFDANDQLAVIDAVRALGAQVVRSEGLNIVISAALDLVPQLAALPQVRAVNPYRSVHLHNNVATGLIHADVLHTQHGLNGSNQIVGIGDTGLDTGLNDASMLDDFEGRIVNLHALGRPGNASDPDGHGTHVAGSVLGNGANSNGNIRGTAPAARLVFQSILDNTGGLGGIPVDLGIGLFDVARDEGARIHTNSWGADVNGAYNSDSTQADRFAFNNRAFLICFSAGNDAPNRVGAPGTAKNVLTIGASESLRTLPASVSFPASPRFPNGATANGFATQADDQNQITNFSSVGPAQNDRRKPDVVAPGSWILSTRSSVSLYDAGPDGLGPHEAGTPVGFPTGTGDEDGIASHPEAVGLGLPGQPIFRAGSANTPDLPAGSGGAAAQQNYMYLSGTSMATPLTAGACALVRQYLVEQRGHSPSAALLKALMVNGAVDIGLGVPHTGQGWGRIDLTNTLFPTGSRRIQFDDSLDNAVATGDIRTYEVFISSSAAPLTVTLVWRDFEGATIQNRLHLRVTHMASATTQTADAIGDIRNNVQKVIFPAPTIGLYRIEVEGVNITHAIPEFAPALRQDYALVVANATGFSCNPSDIVQVIDRSGSMGFSGYMEPAKARAKQMIDSLQINDHAGLVTFRETASEILALTPINSQDDKDDAHLLINPITAGGTTDLREGLEQGVTTLGAVTGRPRAIIFLSDGFHTVPTPAIDDVFLDGITAAGIKVYTIGLGPESDFAVLNNIANRTGTGSVYSVTSAADLHKLHEIYYDILGGVGCGGVIHLNSAMVPFGEGLTETVQVDGSVNEVHFALSWEATRAKLDFVLERPDGTTIDPSTVDVFHFAGDGHQFYRLQQPKPGTWKLLIKNAGDGQEGEVRVTSAALADSAVKCVVQVDPKFLFHGKVLLSLKASYQDKPLLGGKVLASIAYPTRSVDDLLREHADTLKQIKIDPELLNEDRVDLDLLRLSRLVVQFATAGKDLFESKTVDIALTDDGAGEDPAADDGIYTSFFDPAANGVAGNFQIRVTLQAEQPEFGLHTCTKLVPVYVPRLREEPSRISLSKLTVKRNRLWRYVIIGAAMSKPDGTLASPTDNVQVCMTLMQGLQRINSDDLPYYKSGQYYMWRLPLSSVQAGEATLQIQTKLNGAQIKVEMHTVRF